MTTITSSGGVAHRLNSIALGEAMFTQRAIRRFRKDPIPGAVMDDIMQAAIRAPNGGNNQQWHFIVVQDAEKRRQLGELYHEAWWAKRADAGIHGPQDIPPGKSSMRSAMRLANEIGDAPAMVLVCATAKGPGGGRLRHPRRAEYAAGGPRFRHWRHYCHPAPGGGGAGTRPL